MPEKEKGKPEPKQPEKKDILREGEEEAIQRLRKELTPWNRAMMHKRTVRASP